MTSNGHRFIKACLYATSVAIMAVSIAFSTATLMAGGGALSGCSACQKTGCSQCNIDGFCNSNGNDTNIAGCTCDSTNICTPAS